MSDLETKPKKRSTSIITVFLWLLLIAIMSTILIGSIFQENKLKYDRTITIKVDFTELIESGSIPEEYIDDELASFSNSIYVTNNHINNWAYKVGYIGREGNIFTYKVDFNSSEANYMEFSLGSEPYDVLENGNLLEIYIDEYGDSNYIKEITEEQDLYEFKLQKMKFDTTLELKIDFSDFLNDESIPEEYMNQIIPLFTRYAIAFTKDNISSVKYDTRYMGLEGNIASYEVDFNAIEANYIAFWSIYDEYIHGYRVWENGDLLESFQGEYGDKYYVRQLTPNQDVYEFKLEKQLSTEINIEKPFSDFSIELWIKEENKEAVQVTRYFSYSNKMITFIVDELSQNSNYTLYIIPEKIEEYSIYEGDSFLIFDETMNAYKKEIKGYTIKDEYNFEVSSEVNIHSSIKWNDVERKEALLEFGASRNFITYEGLYIIFSEKLGDGFTISTEYENAPNWLIVNENEIINDSIDISVLDLDNNTYDYVPRYIFANFFQIGDKIVEWNGKYQYIYLKDKNILYTILNYPNRCNQVKLEYQGDIEKDNLKVGFDTKAITLVNWNCGIGMSGIGYVLGEKSLNLVNEITANIDVNKLVENQTGKFTYYVGLFENELDSKTDKVYALDTVDGIGSTTITIENYDGTTPYYIYEVDEAGNKIFNLGLDYSKNKVLENLKPDESNTIVTDKNIVSMVGNSVPDVIGTGLGEEYYIDNKISIEKVYKDTVTISSNYEEKVHVVKFEAGEGGRIEGATSIVVKDGETIDTIVNAIANAHYSFDKWVVVENGVEKEVDPSSYVITEDTTFIAKFKKEKYTVKYESGENGRLEGNLEEVVEYGNSPALIPSIVSDENYEFDKWVVVENGVEKEVNLSNYKVEKDVTFIAKYKKINTIETSDIEVWKYVGIGAISIFVIAIIVVLIVMRKKNKNK